MALTPAVLEMGMGIDLHGQNATEAARRAVWNAVHQSSLMFLGVFGPETSKNMIVAGNKDGPVENVCSKAGWVPPGPDAGNQCTKMKERYICIFPQKDPEDPERTSKQAKAK